MNKFDQVPIPVVAVAIMVAVVALVGAARWFAPQEPVATDLTVPAQAWDATSTQPSYGEMEAPVESNALPAFCLLYTSPSPRDGLLSRMPSSA